MVSLFFLHLFYYIVLMSLSYYFQNEICLPSCDIFFTINIHFGITANFSHLLLSIDCYCQEATQNQLHHSYGGFRIARLLLHL